MTDLPQDDYVEPRDDWMDRDGPIYQPQNPRWPGWQKNTSWAWSSEMLKSESTKMVWVGPNLKWWDLSGNLRGRQGVIATNEITGIGIPPFEQKFLEGPYIAGASLERTDYKRRVITFGVVINPNTNRMDKTYRNRSAFKYRLLEQSWWESFSSEQYGYLGFFTRTTGWRWIKCYLNDDSANQKFSMDPVAFKNNQAQYDMSLVCADPYFYKLPLYKTWRNDPTRIRNGWGEGSLKVANRGELITPPMYLVTAPGQAYIGDGPERMIPMPVTSTADKFYLVDTNENMKTLNGAVDPIDNPFYRFIRQAGLINFFLHDLASQGLPLWRRWENPQIFDFAIGPKTAPTVRVMHNYPNAEITMIMPQKYQSAWM